MKKTKNNIFIYLILSCLLFLAPTQLLANEVKEPIDVKEAILGHMSDAYEWHITT